MIRTWTNISSGWVWQRRSLPRLLQELRRSCRYGAGFASFYEREQTVRASGTQSSMEFGMRIIVMTCTTFLLLGAHACAEVLITASEAAQPPSTDVSMSVRGIT